MRKKEDGCNAEEKQGEHWFLFLGFGLTHLLRRGGVRIPWVRSEQQEGR